jgi:hypothetical protein
MDVERVVHLVLQLRSFRGYKYVSVNGFQMMNTNLIVAERGFVRAGYCCNFGLEVSMVMVLLVISTSVLYYYYCGGPSS